MIQKKKKKDVGVTWWKGGQTIILKNDILRETKLFDFKVKALPQVHAISKLDPRAVIYGFNVY